MNKLIDVNAFKNSLTDGTSYTKTDIIALLDKAPAIEAKIITHASWIDLKKDNCLSTDIIYHKFKCSQCGNVIETDEPPIECSSCHSQMDNVSNS